MAKQTKNQTTTGRQSTIDVDEIAKNATASTGDFSPIMDFGPKNEPGKWRVTFDETKPRLIEKEFDDGKRIGINVRAARVLPDGTTAPEEDACIFMRPEADKNGRLHSLTNGVLALYRENGNDLKGVRAVIRKRIYDHEKYGATPAYDVIPVHE